ncbi:MAG TPA: HlyD family secretion protein [Rheinheimera sp.]|nr:HlyD family secretion protein [Rheinheimera sp.]
MTADQIFKRWVHGALAVFVLAFVYFIIADIWLPLSAQARVMHPVVAIAPDVSGQVTQVLVQNNQQVKAGDTLFTLDKRPYQLTVDKAELALEVAQQQNAQLDAAIASAQASVAAYQAQADELGLEVKRLQQLIGSRSVSQQQLDKAAANYQAALAQVEAARAQTHELVVRRGEAGEGNLLLRQAANALANAQLNLQYTEVRAKVDGVMANLQLVPGHYASAGKTLAALVANNADIIADFREKSLTKVNAGTAASVVFDGLPGQVFAATVTALDAGVKAGQLNADGSLANPESSDRWVRDAQYLRLHLTLDDNDAVLAALPTGARATVQLYPAAGPARWLGQLQARFISLLHYIY